MDASIAPELAALLAEADALRRIVALDADERERERESARASESEKTGQLTDKLRGTNEQVLSLLALPLVSSSTSCAAATSRYSVYLLVGAAQVLSLLALLVSSYKSTRCARENGAARRPLSPFPPLERGKDGEKINIEKKENIALLAARLADELRGATEQALTIYLRCSYKKGTKLRY